MAFDSSRRANHFDEVERQNRIKNGQKWGKIGHIFWYVMVLKFVLPIITIYINGILRYGHFCGFFGG